MSINRIKPIKVSNTVLQNNSPGKSIAGGNCNTSKIKKENGYGKEN